MLFNTDCILCSELSMIQITTLFLIKSVVIFSSQI